MTNIQQWWWYDDDNDDDWNIDYDDGDDNGEEEDNDNGNDDDNDDERYGENDAIGSFSNKNSDSYKNVKTAMGLLNETSSLYLHHAFLYISFPLLHD